MAKRARRFEAPVQDMETSIPVIKTAGYVRLSVDKNDRKTESIENQKQVIEAYINRHNENPERKFVLELAGFYEDKGLTGTDFDRKGFENLINDAKSGQINCIIVKDFSRFGRDFLDGCNYIENVLPFLEVRFIAISDQYDSMAHDAASRRFEVRLKNLINEMYALESSEKVSDVKALSQRRGSFIGSRCPYGYRAEWVNGIRTLFPSGDAALEVQRMYAMYLNGATINDILDYLYEKRVNRPKEWLETGKTYAEENEPIFRWRRGSVQDILRNVVHGDTLLEPQHLNKQKNGLMKFDYIVSNPPFNVDFSDNRDTLAGENYKERFWAGVPKVPNKDKDKMAIYQMFLQHIIYSLKEDGKAAVVVPTGFLTAGTGIPKSIREYIIKERMLRGVISMPSNIFATTGTNVSILFLDRANKDGKVLLMDASKLGHKEKVDGKNQRTVLEPEEIQDIIGTFINGEEKDDFSVLVDYEQIEQKKLSFSAGQYFEVKIEYVELTPEEFDAKMNDYTVELQNLFAEGNKLQQEILEQLKKVRYE